MHILGLARFPDVVDDIGVYNHGFERGGSCDVLDNIVIEQPTLLPMRVLEQVPVREQVPPDSVLGAFGLLLRCTGPSTTGRTRVDSVLHGVVDSVVGPLVLSLDELACIVY